MKIGSGTGLAPSRQQGITWVSGDPGQLCIHASLGLIELITSPYWENISMRRKKVLFEHTRYAFTPIAESGQFRSVRSGQVEGGVINSPILSMVNAVKCSTHWHLVNHFLHEIGFTVSRVYIGNNKTYCVIYNELNTVKSLIQGAPNAQT